MNAIIVGAGKVGSELAETLVNDGHSVSLIDISQKTLDAVSEELDVMTFTGNGADIDILKEAGIENADIFIAVGTTDETNLLSCLMVKQLSDCETIARVRSPFYSRQTEFFKAKLGISKIINPEFLAASEIYHLLQFPALSRLDFFENTNVAISTMHVTGDYKLVGKSLMQMGAELKNMKVLICAVVRGDKVIIPSGNFVIEENDDITMIALRNDMRRFIKEEGIPNKPADDVLIVGGGTISYYLIERLLHRGKNVRLIEKDENVCIRFSEYFPEAEIIKGDGTDRKFLQKHGLSTAEAFVPLTGIDEENIIISTYAKSVTKAKIITKASRTDMGDMIKTLALDSVVFPKTLCSDIIAQYVRAMQAGAKGKLSTLFRYLDNRIEIAEYIAGPEIVFLGIPFSRLNIKKDLIVSGLIRNGEFLIPSGSDSIHEKDSVIIVTTQENIKSLQDIVER